MKKRLEWRVGLFVFIGLVLLAVLLIGFSKGFNLFRPTYTILLDATDVAGLQQRASVLMSGVQVGTVSGITLAKGGSGVTITLQISKRYVIHKDARFTIEQSGFLGDQYISIQPTKNAREPFDMNRPDHASAEKPFNLQEVARSATGFVQRLDDTAKGLNEAIEEVRRLLLNPTTLTNLAVTIANLKGVSERASRTVDSITAAVDTNAPSLAQSSSNLVTFTERLNEVAAQLQAIVDTNAEPLHASVRNVEVSTQSLKELLADVQAGKGLAGSALKNEETAAAFANVVHNLSITSSNLNRLGLWGILWKKKVSKPALETTEPLTSPKQSPQ